MGRKFHNKYYDKATGYPTGNSQQRRRYKRNVANALKLALEKSIAKENEKNV